MENNCVTEKNPAFEAVTALLRKSCCEFRIHTHPEVRTIADADARVPHLTRNLLKTIVFRIKNGSWILAAVHKDDRIDYKKLAKTLGVTRKHLRSIAPEQVTHELAFQVGGVGPFPIREDVQVVLDEKLIGIGSVFCGSGVNTQTVEIDLNDLALLTRATTGPISKSTI